MPYVGNVIKGGRRRRRKWKEGEEEESISVVEPCIIVPRGRKRQIFIHARFSLIFPSRFFLFRVPDQGSRTDPLRPGLQAAQPAGGGLLRTGVPPQQGHGKKNRMETLSLFWGGLRCVAGRNSFEMTPSDKSSWIVLISAAPC